MGHPTVTADFSEAFPGDRGTLGGGRFGGPVSAFTVEAGKTKIVLSVLKSHGAIRVRISHVSPDLTDVGGTLEEAKALRHEHDELLIKLNETQAEVVASMVRSEGKGGDVAENQKIEGVVSEAWKDISRQMEDRKMLLDQSVAFHNSAIQFGKKMQQVETKCTETPMAQDVETARRHLQHHQDLKKSVLEASMSTLQEGQLLLERIRKMALSADVQNRHATTTGCYAIEQLLLNLQDRKRHLDDLWWQRKLQLEQCIRLLLLDQEAGKITKWLDETGEEYLKKKDLGDSLDSANSLLDACLSVEQQFVAAPQIVRRLIGAVEYLTHPVAADKDAARQRYVALEQRCDNFVSRLNVRRKNISMSAYFFALLQDSLLKLEEVEVLLSSTDVPRNSPALADRHLQLSHTIVEASVATLHTGRTILGRVGKDDPSGAAISAKVTELQDRCTRFQGLCDARPEPEKQPSEGIAQLSEKYHKLNAWVKYVGQASLDRYSEMGMSISDANDFLISHRGISEELKAKQVEAKSLVTSAEELVKSGDKDSQDVHEKVKILADQFEKLIALADRRNKIALAYVVLHKREQQLSVQLNLLEEHLKQEKLDPSLISESTIKQREDAFRRMTTDCTEIERIGKQFLNDVNEANSNDRLNTEFVIRNVSLMLSNFTDRRSITEEYFTHWKAFAAEGRNFTTQWKQFVQDARKSIDWVMKVEDGFFPKLAGELGSSLTEVQQHQKRLDEFKPTIKKAQEEIEKHLKAAELLSLKGNTRGQRDQIVNELLKVHTRFQARIGEYKYLLNMATKFFENLQELDKLIATTEKEYASEDLPKEVSSAEAVLRQHNSDRIKLKQLIDYSSEEADQIVIRVRQQDSEEVAKDDVQRVLHLTEEKRSLWEKAWDDHKKRLEQSLQASQFYFDLKQLQDELDQLQRQVDSRQGSYGNSLASVKMIVQAYIQLEKMADAIHGRFKSFVGTSDKMIRDGHFDSRRIRHEVEETEKRWNTFYGSIKNYRISLEASIKFYDKMDECEGWISDAGQFLLGISRQAPSCKTSADADNLIAQIQKYKTEGAMVQDGRLNNMECIATDLYGSVLGPEKMQHILDKNQEMFNAFIKAIEDLAVLRNNLINAEQILANMGAVVEKKTPRQPRFVLPLQNAEIIEGQRFTFECRLECDTSAPTLQWLKDNEPVKGFVPSFKDGLCTLTIDETMLRDSGQFTCKVTTEAGSAETSASLKVKDLQQKSVRPEFTKQLKPMEVAEGTSCLLECHLSGIPFPTVTWFKDDTALTNSAEHVITIDGGVCCMKIRKLTKGHSATYKCKATNPGGDASTSASVNVISVKKPEFTEPLKDVNVAEGKSVRLECRYNGDPAPQIQWLFNDTPILPSALFKIIVDDNFTALEIHEVFPEDCGNYSATARNLGGEARTSCLLSVIGVRPIVSARSASKPEFVQPLRRCEVQEGGRVRLECTVTGYPAPEILWYHNDKPVKKTKDFDISFDNGRCLLIVNEVYLEDSGEYLCTARNEHGAARTNCRLVVEPLSELSDTGASLTGEVPPKFTQLLKDIEGFEGELVRFECRVIGHPTPVIKWYSGRNQLSSSPEFQITSERELQTLTIPKAHKEDAGNYMVKATNAAGIAKCYATLIVKEGDQHAVKMRLIESSHSVQTSFIEGCRPPEVVRSFHDIHVRPGQPCTLEVIIVGTPKPKISWLFNNEPIVSQDYKVSALGDVYSLYIPEVFEQDAGRFSVIAENDAGKAWCSALIVVVDMSQLLADEGSPPDTPQVPHQTQPGFGPPPVVPKIIPQQMAQQFRPPPAKESPPVVVPKFVEPLKNVAADEGQRATFEVVVDGRPEPVVRWFKDGRQLQAGEGGLEMSCRDGRARLSIPIVTVKDAGRYTCSVTNVGGEAQSTAELTVKGMFVPPQFLAKLETKNVKEGDSVRFAVQVSGKPRPTVTWFREGVQIISSPDFILVQDGDLHFLDIPEVFYEDSGKFTVKADSPGGQARCTAELIVEGQPSKAPPRFTSQKTLPQFLKGLSNRTAQVGQRVTLECVLPPHPVPDKVHWFHNEIELFISPRHAISYADGACSLSITKVVPESRGRYRCEVFVEGLGNSTDMNLDVIGEPEREPQVPQFEDKLKNVKLQDGKDAVFVCRVLGHPPPNVQWFHNGHIVRPSQRHEIKYTKDGICSLRIRSVQREDAGIYTCAAANPLGQEYSSAELYVEGASFIDETSYVDPDALRRMTGSPGHAMRDRERGGVSEQYFKPVFRKIPTDLEVPEGSVARFDSVVAGRPIPDMLWYRDGVQVFDDRLHKIVINEEGINSIIFDAVVATDAGQYTCIAKNRAGEDRFVVHLNVLPRQAAAPPRFASRLNNQSIAEGQSVMFTVEVEGFPIPMLSWQREGCHITISDHYQIRTEGHRSTLFIPVVGQEDNAWFQCTAASAAGVSTNRVKLVVQASEPRVTQRATYTQSSSPAPRRTTPVAPSPVPVQRSSPWQQQQQYTETSRVETTFETQARRPGSAGSSEAAPKLIEPTKDQQVMEGNPAQFRCKIFSATEPRFEWFFDNRLIHPSNKYRMSADDGVYVLNIANISLQDAGIYKCVVSNQGGEVTCIAHLRVGSQLSRLTPVEHVASTSVPPHFAKPMSDCATNVGRSADFEVGIQSQPPAEVVWFLNGQQIRPSENFQVLRTNGTYTLRIKQVSPESVGVITCRAANPFGTRECSARLAVDVPGATTTTTTSTTTTRGEPPRFSQPLTNADAVDGSEVRLSCVVTGRPLPDVSWFHNDKNIDRSSDFAITYDDRTGRAELVIVDCMTGDQGLFRCVAGNDNGRAETECRLTVKSNVQVVPIEETVQPVLLAPKTIAVPDASFFGEGRTTTIVEVSQGNAPRFVKPIQPCVVVEGQSCTFTAVVVGDPRPEIAWLKEKEDLVMTDRHTAAVDVVTGTCFLRFDNCQQSDTGIYSCRASNAAGRATCTANVVVVRE